MVITQDPNDPSDSFLDGYGNTRRMADLKVPFTATVNPCAVTLTTNDPPDAMTYTLGDPAMSQLYEIVQTPSCYNEVVTLDVPWLTVDPNTGTGTINLG